MSSIKVPAQQDGAKFTAFLPKNTTHAKCYYIDWTPENLSKLKALKALVSLKIQGKLPSSKIVKGLKLDKLSITNCIGVWVPSEDPLEDDGHMRKPRIKLTGLNNLRHLTLDETVIVPDLDQLPNLEILVVTREFWVEHRENIRKCTNLKRLWVKIPFCKGASFDNEDGDLYYDCHDIYKWAPEGCSCQVYDPNTDCY